MVSSGGPPSFALRKLTFFRKEFRFTLVSVSAAVIDKRVVVRGRCQPKTRGKLGGEHPTLR